MRRRKQQHRRGMALMLVVAVMAVATVMGYAMVSSGAMQAQVAANGTAAANAQAQAESGLSLAMYYLQNPKNAASLAAAVPANKTPAYWAGGSGLTFGGVSGELVSLTVAPRGTNGLLWDVTSVGNSAADGSGVSRTVRATVQVNSVYYVRQAAACNVPLTLGANMSVTGSPNAVTCNGKVTIGSTAHVTGSVAASSVSGTPAGSVLPAPSGNASPALADLRSYSTYTYQGKMYSATVLGSNTVSTNLAPSVSNPAGVFIAPNDLKLVGNVSVTGTLIVMNGNLSIRGANVTISPVSGFPAVVVSNILEMYQSGKGVTINGVAFLNGGIGVNSGTGLACSVVIKGAMLIPTGGISASYHGSLNLTYTSANVNVPDLSQYNTVPQSAKVVSWQS